MILMGIFKLKIILKIPLLYTSVFAEFIIKSGFLLSSRKSNLQIWFWVCIQGTTGKGNEYKIM